MFKLYKTTSRLSNVKSDYVLTQNSDSECDSVFFNRLNGEITIRKFRRTIEFEEVTTEPIYGYIGKFQVNPNYPPKLIFIKSADKIGKLKVINNEHTIYRIKEILILTFTPPSSSTHDEIEPDVLMNDSDLKQSASFSALGSLITGAPSPVLGSTSTENTAKTVSSVTSKFEKKVLIEVYKIFHDN